MSEGGRSKGWRALAVLTVLAALASTAERAQSGPGCQTSSDCGCTNLTNCSAPDQAGICVNGTCECNPGYIGLFCENRTGACCGVESCASGAGVASLCAGAPCTDTTEQNCAALSGAFAGNGTTCASGACDSSTPTETPLPTATPTRAPQGADCAEPSQCLSDFCVDGVCCDTACDGPLDTCVPDGVCAVAAAPAPAASHTGLALMVAAVTLVGLAAMLLRRRRA